MLQVFKAMFSYDQLIESTEKKVVIEDAEYEAVRYPIIFYFCYLAKLIVESFLAS